jgi:hypothetical protein
MNRLRLPFLLWSVVAASLLHAQTPVSDSLRRVLQAQLCPNPTRVRRLQAVKSKISQPFFTTKPSGEGTGLGLSLAHDIVTKGHGGTLSVNSQRGQGTGFTLSLPR